MIIFPQGLCIPNTTASNLAILSNWLIGPQSDALPLPHSQITDPYVLVCTHMKRDKKCGVAGPMLIAELVSEIGKVGCGARVLAVSHFGGHKFAGNIIVYRKDGRSVWVADWYGRVKTCHVHGIVRDAVIEGKVIKDLWRGRMNADVTDPALTW